MKKHFANYGLPDCVTIDRRLTVKKIDISRVSLNLRIQRVRQDFYNRMVKGIKTANRLMVKFQKAAKDPYLALFDWRNTPSECLDNLSFHRMFGRTLYHQRQDY